MSMGIL